MKPAMYIFVNKGLGMSAGKMAAQVAHAACLATEFNADCSGGNSQNIDKAVELWDAWWNTGHYTKYVMELPDCDRMDGVERYLNDRGFKTFMVIDEGRTEDTFFQKTALAVELVDKSDERTRNIFQAFQTYQD